MTAPYQTKDAKLYMSIYERLNTTAEEDCDVLNTIAALTDDMGELKGFNDETHPAVKAMLIVSEVAEFVEEVRRDGVAPEAVAEELADVVIRTLHLAKMMNIAIGQAVFQKLCVNLQRPYKHGKKF